MLGALIFIMIKSDNDNIKNKLDKLLSSDQIEVIFFERDNDSESNRLKDLLDNDLKNQRITYTTINITNATEEDISYINEKFN